MTRITPTQQRRIVGLFQSGTTMSCLAEVWKVEVAMIEAIIRKAMMAMRAQEGNR